MYFARDDEKCGRVVPTKCNNPKDQQKALCNAKIYQQNIFPIVMVDELDWQPCDKLKITLQHFLDPFSTLQRKVSDLPPLNWCHKSNQCNNSPGTDQPLFSQHNNNREQGSRGGSKDSRKAPSTFAPGRIDNTCNTMLWDVALANWHYLAPIMLYFLKINDTNLQ